MKKHKAFTIVELVFVIVIMGILGAVAVPKLAPFIQDAHVAKAKETLAAVRSALGTERQKLVLRGVWGNIVKLRNSDSGVFTNFVYKDNNNQEVNGSKILEYDVKSCTHHGCWSTSDGVTYTYVSKDGNCTYKLENNRFVDKTSGGCSELEK